MQCNSGHVVASARTLLQYYGAESVHKGLGGVQDSDKKAMEEETGLSTTQINNWFINQRKRHWHKVRCLRAAAHVPAGYGILGFGN